MAHLGFKSSSSWMLSVVPVRAQNQPAAIFFRIAEHNPPIYFINLRLLFDGRACFILFRLVDFVAKLRPFIAMIGPGLAGLPFIDLIGVFFIRVSRLDVSKSVRFIILFVQ